MRLRRRHFAELIERQLDLFANDSRALLADVEAALRAYDAASAELAEERYGDFVDRADLARDELDAIRDAYATTLDDPDASEYVAAFDERARKRFPRITEFE